MQKGSQQYLDITDIKCTVSAESVAQSYLSEQIRSLEKHMDGAKSAKEIEDVHQVRVACRRLRAGLRFLSNLFEPDLLKSWQKALKKALKKFGPARDTDVQLQFLRTLSQQSEPLKNCRYGIKRILLRLEQKRQRLQKKIIKLAERFEKKHLLLEMELALHKLDKKQEHITILETLAAKRLSEFLSAVHKYLPSLEDPTALQEHHRLRIAVKKLRYGLEICDIAVDGKLKTQIKQLKHFQEILGQMHDCDVWQDVIRQFWAEEQQRTLDYFGHLRSLNRLRPGLDYLAENRQQERLALYQQAKDLAKILNEQNFWQNIQNMVEHWALSSLPAAKV